MSKHFGNSEAIRSYALYLLMLLSFINEGFLTDIEVTSSIIYNLFDRKVYIPVLSCHVKYSGYHSVAWYKDGLNVKNGSSDPAGHLFEPDTLINNSYFNLFKNALELQGYYWCETDSPPADAVVHKFLFQAENFNTFAGSFLATRDSLGNNKSISNEKKIALKKEIYIHEMEEMMFGFWPHLSIFISSMENTKNGLDVGFFLYEFQRIDARYQGDPYLIQDEVALYDIMDHLHNATMTDPEFYSYFLEWLDFRGIDLDQISLRSTIGCYAVTSPSRSKVVSKISWPYTFLGDISMSEESCTTKDDLPITRKCIGSFNEGASWDSVVGICEKQPHALTKFLKELSKKIRQTQTSDSYAILEGFIVGKSDLSTTDVIIIANMLGKLSFSVDFNEMEEDSIFGIINALLQANPHVINLAKQKLQFTKRILLPINNVIKEANTAHVLLKSSKSNMLVFTRDTDVGDRFVSGAFVTTPVNNSTLENSTVEFLVNGTDFSYYESKAGFLLPTELIVKRESELKYPCQLNMVFFKDWTLFKDPEFSTIQSTVNPSSQAPVMMITISGGPIWNLNYPTELFFKHEFQDSGIPTCVYFDSKRDSSGGWSTEGCSYKGLRNGFHVCHCLHLSIFSIITTESKISKSPIFSSHLSLYIGCITSIAALMIVVLMYTCSKTWRQTIDQDILFHISLSFLCSLILLIVHGVHSKWEPGCLLLSHMFFGYVLAMFCWVFILSIVYHVRFSRKAETNDISHFLTKCTIFSWGFPLIVMTLIGISTNYRYHEQKTCWPTVVEVSGVAIIPIIIILVLAMGLYVNANYSISCRYKRDLIVGTPKYKEDALKFRAAITLVLILFLAWLFGYLALSYEGKEMQILFSIFTIVASICLSLFFIFQELSLGEIVRRKKDNISAPLTEKECYENQSYKSIEY